MVPQRVPGAPGPAGLHTATDLLLRVLGAIILLMLLYSVFARVVRRDSSPSTGFVKDDVFLDVVARLRGKEHELERLRSAAEERAREIESYNENILRSVSSGVITFNPEGVVTTFNDAAGRILRLTQEDVIGKTCDEVFGANSTVAGLLKRCLSTGEAITREEFELRLPHGGRFWIGVSTTLLKDREGRLIGTTFVCTDLTEIKALQEQVEMRERMTVLGQMSAAIAHEFRNLMGTILGAAKLIARDGPHQVAELVGDGSGHLPQHRHALTHLHLLLQRLDLSEVRAHERGPDQAALAILQQRGAHADPEPSPMRQAQLELLPRDGFPGTQAPFQQPRDRAVRTKDLVTGLADHVLLGEPQDAAGGVIEGGDHALRVEGDDAARDAAENVPVVTLDFPRPFLRRRPQALEFMLLAPQPCHDVEEDIVFHKPSRR